MIKHSDFKTPWWLANPHLQTIWPTLFWRQPLIDTVRERFELPDGDFVDLDWAGNTTGPLVLILHGLGGSIKSPYARGLLHAFAEEGWCAVFMHFRGCSGEPNRLARYYHCGDTNDVNTLVAALRKRYPRKPMAAVGISLGGNVLLKWLGETGSHNPLLGAVAVSVPFELEKAANRVNIGFSRLYQWWILRSLISLVQNKFKTSPAMVPIDMKEVNSVRNFLEFDDRVTAPLHGFTDAKDYYTKSSSRPFLKHIKVPTLVLHSIDDPFMTADVIAEDHELSPHLTLEISQGGGHVGFVTGTPWQPKYWLEERILLFLREVFKK